MNIIINEINRELITKIIKKYEINNNREFRLY